MIRTHILGQENTQAKNKKWTTKEILSDIWDATYDCKRLVKIAEKIYMKGVIKQ